MRTLKLKIGIWSSSHLVALDAKKISLDPLGIPLRKGTQGLP